MQARTDELRRAGAGNPRAPRPPVPLRSRPTSVDESVTLRFAFPDDALALARLTALDSSETLSEPVLLAEVSGELRAALSLASGATVADPFHPSAALIDLLRARAAQLSRAGAGADGRAGSRRGGRLRGRLGLAAWR